CRLRMGGGYQARPRQITASGPVCVVGGRERIPGVAYYVQSRRTTSRASPPSRGSLRPDAGRAGPGGEPDAGHARRPVDPLPGVNRLGLAECRVAPNTPAAGRSRYRTQSEGPSVRCRATPASNCTQAASPGLWTSAPSLLPPLLRRRHAPRLAPILVREVDRTPCARDARAPSPPGRELRRRTSSRRPNARPVRCISRTHAARSFRPRQEDSLDMLIGFAPQIATRTARRRAPELPAAAPRH